MALLEEKAWPVSELDILLLEKEINNAETYIRQAEDLMRLPRQKDEKVGIALKFYDTPQNRSQ